MSVLPRTNPTERAATHQELRDLERRLQRFEISPPAPAVDADELGLVRTDDARLAPSYKHDPTAHTHPIAEVTGLQAQLDALAAADGTGGNVVADAAWIRGDGNTAVFTIAHGLDADWLTATVYADAVPQATRSDLTVERPGAGSLRITFPAAPAADELYRVLIIGTTLNPSAPPPAAVSYRNTVLADGPEAFWTLGEASGTVAADVTGNGNDGTYAGTVQLAQAGALEGDTDTAARFSGGYLVTALAFSELGTSLDALAIELWVKPESAGDGQIAYLGNYGTYTPNWHCISAVTAGSGTQIQLVTYDGASQTITAAVTPGAWHHVVFRFSAGSQEIWVNGKLAATGARAAAQISSSAPLMVAAQLGGAAASPGVTLDAVAAYGAALTAAQVAEHYRMGARYRRVALGLGPSGYWRLGEPSGSVAAAEVGPAGTYIGDVTYAQPGALTDDTAAAIGLDGATAYMQAPQNIGGPAGSVSIWGKLTALDAERCLFQYVSSSSPDTNSHVLMVGADGHVRVRLYDGASKIAASSAGLVDAGAWHHFVFTWADSGTLLVYLDGTQVASVAIGTSFAACDMIAVGYLTTSGESGYWNGAAQELETFSRALTATEVQQLYLAGLHQ